MLKLVKTHVYWWPVVVAAPDPDVPGGFAEHRFDVQFKAIPSAEAIALDGLPDRDALLRRVVVDWRDVWDETGNAVPLTPEALAAALQWPWIRLSVYRAYHRSITGQGQEARATGN